jgi:hypothetical protein
MFFVDFQGPETTSTRKKEVTMREQKRITRVVVEAAGVELFSVLTARKLLIS